MDKTQSATAVKEYRTREQFLDMLEEMDNGNFQDAGRKCVEHGFWASDIVKTLEECDVYDIDYTDFIILIEIAMQFRAKNN